MGEDLVGTVTDGNILVWGGFNGNTEPMNGFSNEFIIYGESKDDEFLQNYNGN